MTPTARTPEAGVIQAKDGTLYGTTFDGRTDSQGKLAFGNVYAIHGLPPVTEAARGRTLGPRPAQQKGMLASGVGPRYHL